LAKQIRLLLGQNFSLPLRHTSFGKPFYKGMRIKGHSAHVGNISPAGCSVKAALQTQRE
jgi:hypothetical protein